MLDEGLEIRFISSRVFISKSFRVEVDPETGQTIISGMGELHLEIIVDRLMREFGVDANVGKPQVSYRETITKDAQVEGKYIRQSGGKGQYGHVVVKFEPNDYGRGYEFEDKTKGGAIPKEYIKSVGEGIEEAMSTGEVAGYPVVDVKATLIDGSYHDVDSSELSFKVAAEIAFKEGLRKAQSVVLEPIMSLEVISPEDYVSQVIGDLNSRRSRICGVAERKNLRILKAEVPLAEAFNYADTLRNLTQGRASYTIEPLSYEKVPPELLGKILGV